MQSKVLRVVCLFLFLPGGIISASNGPYLGNSIHNGWVDQDSIVIWSRLTTIPDRVLDGPDFIFFSRAEMNELEKELDDAVYLARQVPEGAVLSEMVGACPGSPGEIRIHYFPSDNIGKKQTIDWQPVDETKNYTLQWKLEKLTAGTEYTIIVEARSGKDMPVSDQVIGRFKTAPKEDAVEPIRFSVVSCHDYNRKDQPNGHQIYRSMSNLDLDFYIHTGDIEYYDAATPWALSEPLMYFKWDRLFALPLQREFWANHSSYFMKDDHDILTNDAWPGMTYGTVSWERGIEIFDKEQFPTNHKTYKTIRWGKDLQIWITEGRNHRSPNDDPDGPGKTILGEEQKQWLFETLLESDAAFKVIISANPILGPDRTNKFDNYANANFTHEGDEIREFLSNVDNVYLANGDRHWQYVTYEEDYDLWEFGCGAGADEHAGGWSQDDYRDQHRFLRVKGGFLTVETYRNQGAPTISFKHHDVDGNVVNDVTFTHD